MKSTRRTGGSLPVAAATALVRSCLNCATRRVVLRRLARTDWSATQLKGGFVMNARYLVAWIILPALLTVSHSAFACANGRLTDGAFWKSISVTNGCGEVIRYRACAVADQAFPNRGVASGFVNPGQTGQAPFGNIPNNARVTSVHMTYCRGAHCDPSAPVCH